MPKKGWVLTGRGNAIMRALVVLLALVSCWEEVFTAEGERAGLALEGEEVDKAAEGLGALVADIEQLSVALLRRG